MKWSLLALVLLAGCRAKKNADKAPVTRPEQRHVTLVEGIGVRPFPISTRNPEAQAFFNQGLAFVYAFNHEEARRAFERAAALDPQAAMPWWGVALALSPNYNDTSPGVDRRTQALAASAKARGLEAGVTPRERDYIDALAVRYAAAPADHPVQGEAYARAMAGLAARYPDDLDAATLAAEARMDMNAWNLWSADGVPRPGTAQIVATLRGVIARDPNHVGANHLLIHAVEASGDPGMGLASAGRIAGLAPAAGHLVHMPSHIYQRTGNFDGSAIANERATFADDAYYRSLGNPPVGTLPYDSYRVHNLYFRVAGCNMAGEDACAQKAAAALANYVAPAVPAGKMNGWFLVSVPWMLVRFGHWEQVLALPVAGPKSTVAMTLYARALAFTATGKRAEAHAAYDAFVQAQGGLPKDFPRAFGTPAATMFDLARLVLEARLAEASGDRTGALATWRKAVVLQDQFGYSEPPDFYYPVRESLGGALLRAGQPQAAAVVFRQDLKRNRGNGRSLFGLWQALVAEHRAVEAARAKAAFDAAWVHADTVLSVVSL